MKSSLTVKDDKLLKKVKKARKNRYFSYMGFGIVAIGGIIATAKGIIVKNNYTVMSGYFMLLVALVGSLYLHYFLKLYLIIEKLEAEIRKQNN